MLETYLCISLHKTISGGVVKDADV
jgi:hypothetical protein